MFVCVCFVVCVFVWFVVVLFLIYMSQHRRTVYFPFIGLSLTHLFQQVETELHGATVTMFAVAEKAKPFQTIVYNIEPDT